MSAHQFTRAVITGGASGLGLALAEQLVDQGASVLISDVVDDRLHAAVAALAQRNRAVQVEGLVADVRVAESHEMLRDAAIDGLGGLDLWVNNAGVASAGPVGEAPLKDWRWTLDINLRGMIYGAHAVLPHFRAQDRGVVLNVASAAGLVNGGHMGAYNVSKSGVVALSETMFQETRHTGVGVTVLCPTFFQTDLLTDARAVRQGVFKLASKAMKSSKMQAADVARVGLKDAAAGRLFSVPMWDGYGLWVARRLMPQRFHELMAWAVTRGK